ncbi:MAG: autotransporter outer membrane beta-barrel domain-containing protein [Synergistaceae bacterium]|nr:autotransporter outer membrane beta-barrel domain-containing protein [Synergistaceae bacterium]
MVNGFIGNDHGNKANISIKNIAGNAFTGISVTLHGNSANHYLAGGGIIGLRSTEASASIGDITGNLFSGVNVITDEASNGSAYIEGGGIIGVDAVSSPNPPAGHASIDNLTNNFFTNVHVDTGDILLGGGLVGLNNNSQKNNAADTYIKLVNANGNIFGNGASGNITVDVGYSLRGGGVIGLNGLSNAKADLVSLTNNVFAGINVEAGTYIRGGGVVGIQINDDGDGKFGPSGFPQEVTVAAKLKSASGNLFYKINVESGNNSTLISSTGGGIDGGGIIGVRAKTGIASLEYLGYNDFKELTVTTNKANNFLGDLIGGGIVGVSAANWAGLGLVEYNDFDDINVNVASTLSGGGVIGVSAAKSSNGVDAIIGNVQNNTFRDVEITVKRELKGGGFIGAVTDTGFVGANDISNNRLFYTNSENKVTIVDGTNYGDLTGGGFAGFVADTNTPGTGDAFINTVRGNELYFMNVTANNIIGGGLIGTVANGFSYIKDIIGNAFVGSTITAKGYIDGGGIIGVTSKSSVTSPSKFLGIEKIYNSNFSANSVTAQGRIMGGLVYTYGLSNGMEIKDSTFDGNVFESLDSNGIVYGTVTIDTGLPNSNTGAHTLTISGATLFGMEVGNAIYELNKNVPRFNSVYFGRVLEANGDYDEIEGHAALVINASNPSIPLVLGDPVRVAQDQDATWLSSNSGKDTFGFNMTVNGSSGEFWWGGANEFKVGANVPAYYKSVNLESGSYTRLIGYRDEVYNPTTLTPYENHNTFSLTAPQFDFNLKPGATVRVEGSNVMTLTNANLLGNLRFVPGGTIWQSTDNFDYPLLTVNTTGQTNIEGSTVGLAPFGEKDDPDLTSGSYFALLETDTPIVGNQANTTARGRQGLLREYDFLIDTLGPDNIALSSPGQRLYAYLHPANSAPQAPREARTLTESRAASLGFLRATWLPDHSYQQADLALYLDGEYKAWVPFAGIDGAWMKADTRGGGEYELSTINGLLGIARENKKPGESFLTGLFLEGGYGDYDTRNFIHYTPDVLDMRGDGSLRYYGVGAMIRREWNNGVRLEGSLRGGRIKNEFHAPEYKDPDTGLSAKYKSTVPYYAAHIGLARAWMLKENRKFDLIGRYFWTRQNSEAAILPNGEIVNFDTDDSHRVRLGGRLTFIKDERREWYLGAAGEYEFGGEVSASAYGYPFDSPDLGGLTGIGEIGWIYRSTKDDDFSFEAGLQGYVGRMRGITGGIRMEWRVE